MRPVRTRARSAADAAEAEFTAVFRDLYPQAYRVAFRLLGDRAAAEDAAAEAFARTYADWERVRGLPYRAAWIMKVAGNVSLNVLARKPPTLAPPRTVEEEDATATRMALISALAALPRRQQEAIVLHHLAGLPEAEVAAVLGVAPNTVKTHLKRGLHSLRGSPVWATRGIRVSPELDETPPRDADTVLPEVLRRGRALRRQQVRQRQAGLLARAAGVMVVVGLVAVVAQGAGEQPTRTEVAAPPTTADEPGSSTSAPTFPPFTAGGSSGTSPSLPGSTTTVGAVDAREAPIAVLEVRDAAGLYHTAVLEPGSLAPVSITAATAERQTPVISPDGRAIAFQRLLPHPITGQPRWEVFVVDPDGTDLKQATGDLGLIDPLLGPGSRWPTWSPDGTQLAFSCSGATGLPQICVAGADGKGRHPISVESQGFYQPVWSPDGRAIAAKREVGDGRVGLWLLDPTGAAAPVALPTRTLPASGATLTWLPNGDLVYPRPEDPAGVLRALDVETGVERAIPTSGPVRFPIACGQGQVLYLQSAAPLEGAALRTGALVLTGTDGTAPTVVLPASTREERVPSSCAMP